MSPARNIPRNLSALATLGAVLTLSACSVDHGPAEVAKSNGGSSSPKAPASSAELEQGNSLDHLAWPADMTLTKPDEFLFHRVSSNFSCDGSILSVLADGSFVHASSVANYVATVADELSTDTHTVEAELPSAADIDIGTVSGVVLQRDEDGQPGKKVSWEVGADQSLRLNLAENPKPGSAVSVRETPSANWVEFPRPDVDIEYCEMRQVQEASDQGVGGGPDTTRTLRTSPVLQPGVQAWLEQLVENGWHFEENPEIPGVGMPGSFVSNDEFRVQYIMDGEYMSVFVSTIR